MAEIKVGEPQVRLDATSHTPGVRQGNQHSDRMRRRDRPSDGTSTARRSTGIDAKAKNPLLPGMPNLSPA